MKPRGHRYTIAPLVLTWSTLLLAWLALAVDAPDWAIRLGGAVVVGASIWMGVWLSRSWKGCP